MGLAVNKDAGRRLQCVDEHSECRPIAAASWGIRGNARWVKPTASQESPHLQLNTMNPYLGDAIELGLSCLAISGLVWLWARQHRSYFTKLYAGQLAAELEMEQNTVRELTRRLDAANQKLKE